MASIENGNGGNDMVMPVAPMYGGYGYNNGMGMNGGDGWWIVLLIILLAAGNGFGGRGAGNPGNGGGYDGMLIQQGFDQAAVTNGIAGVQSSVVNGFSNVQTALCNGFAGVNSNVQNGFAQAEIAANARQIADLQQNFALSQQFANCCCENRLATANLAAQITQENCTDREAISNALFAVTNQMNAGFQSIKDEFCQDRLDRKDEKIAELQAINNELSRQASQNAQTAAILANNEAQTTALEQYLAPVPRPAYIVQNPNCCGNNYGYGCCGSVA